MWRNWWVLAASLLLVRLAAAATPSLAELTPGDAGICISIDGLAPAVDDLLAGQHFARWRAFPPIANWEAKNRPAIELLVAEAGRQVGVAPRDAWRDVLGHRMMLAAWPAEQPGKEHGPGLLLVEASNPATLKQLIDGVFEAQDRAGEVASVAERKHAGVQYQARTLRRRGTHSTIFLASSDQIAILASDEHVLKQVLELLTGHPGAVASLASLPAYRAARGNADPEATLFAFISARPWDATIAAAPPTDGHAARRLLLLDAWRAMQCCWLSLRLSPQIKLDARVEFESLSEHEPLASWIESVARSTTAFDWIPADCLVAVAGSMDLSSLVKPGQSASARDVRAGDEPTTTSDSSAGQEPKPDHTLTVLYQLLDQAFGGLGPSGGGYAIAAERSDAEISLNLVAGIETGRRVAGDSDPLTSARRQESLRSLLLAAVSLVKLSQASPLAEVAGLRRDSLEILTVAGLKNLPDEWLPSFAVAGKTLLAGTSPDVVECSAKMEREKSLGASPRLAVLLREWPSKPDQFLYVDMRGLRGWLSRHSSAVLALATGQSEASDTQSTARQRGLERVLSLLRLADSLVIAIDAEPTGVGLRAVLHIDEPPAP